MTDVFVYGIDPGSGGKDWPVFVAEGSPGKRFALRDPKPWSLKIPQLEQLIEDIADTAKTACCIVALDAPIIRPTEFQPSFAKLRGWPFDVNPFSQRPCEKALTRKPSTTAQSTSAVALALQKYCLWGPNKPLTTEKQQTQLLNAGGVSVQGHMSAPHGPVTSLFRTRLETELTKRGCSLSVQVDEAEKLRRKVVYLVESHPAVSMAFWVLYRHWSPVKSVRRYKGTTATAKQRTKALIELSAAATGYAKLLTSVPALDTDDKLDSFVSLLNGIELACGEADWFGLPEAGYFLIPKPKSETATVFANAWKKAATE